MLPPLRTFWNRLHENWQAGSHSGHTLLWLLRGCFGAIVIGVAWVAFVSVGKDTDPKTGVVVFAAIVCAGFLVMAGDVAIRNKQITTISAVYFGLLLGLLLGTLFSMALEPFLSDTWLAKQPE